MLVGVLDQVIGDQDLCWSCRRFGVRHIVVDDEVDTKRDTLVETLERRVDRAEPGGFGAETLRW